MNKMKKMAPVHPGEILAEEFLGPLGVSQLATVMCTAEPSLSAKSCCTEPLP